MLVKILLITIPLLMAALGILQTLLYLGQKKYFTQWSCVSTEITHSWFLNQLAPDGEQLTEAVISFTYEVGGKQYESNTPALRGYELFPSLKYESALVKKYKLGSHHKARVHPKFPEIAYLEIAPLSKLSTVLAPAMSLLGIGLLFAYFCGLLSILG